MDFIYKSPVCHGNGVKYLGIFFYLKKVQTTVLSNMINPIIHNQRFRLSAHRLIKTVATSALPLSAVVALFMASAPNAVQAAAPPFGPSVGSDLTKKNVFYFSPWGDQLDLENKEPLHVPDTSLPANMNLNIYDILVQPNQSLPFTLYLYTQSPFYTTGSKLIQFKFDLKMDPDEWSYVNFAPESGVTLAACSTQPGPGSNSGPLQCNTDLSDIWKLTNGLFDPDKKIKLGVINGMTKQKFPNDGESDFRVELAHLQVQDPGGASAPLLPGVANQYQDVELQVPAPLPILGVGAAFGSIRKLRKFSARLKTFSMG